MTPRALAAAVAVLAAVAAAPFVASSLRPRTDDRCARDGIVLGQLLRVTVVSAHGASRTFCSVRCAEDWLAQAPEPAARIVVLDDATGGEIDAASAVWVESPILTSRESGERIHAFRRAEDAQAHVRAYGGRVLTTEGERPFRTRRGA